MPRGLRHPRADGLVRFATTPYELSQHNLKDKGMHVTNVSFNKGKTGYRDGKDGADSSKWSFAPLWAHLANQGADVAALWQQLHSLVARTLIAVEPKMSSLVRMWYLWAECNASLHLCHRCRCDRRNANSSRESGITRCT